MHAGMVSSVEESIVSDSVCVYLIKTFVVGVIPNLISCTSAAFLRILPSNAPRPD